MAILWDSEPVSSGDKILQVIDANKFSYTKVGSSGVKRDKISRDSQITSCKSNDRSI